MPTRHLSVFFILAGIALSALAAPILSSDGGKATQLTPLESVLAKAYQALAAKQAEEATRLFREAVRMEPKSMVPLLGLADAARMAKDDRTVDEALRKAMEVAPDRPEPIIALARWQFVRKSYDRAEELLGKAIKLDPKSPVPLVDLGDLHASIRHDPEKAMGYYREAIRLDPKHAGAHYALGSLLLSRRDALGAIASLETAQELVAGKNPLPSLALGRAYGMVRKWKQAQEAFSRALAIQPKLLEAYVGRADAYSLAGNGEAALADLRQAEALAPKRADVPVRMGMLLQEQDAGKAYEAYERAIRIEPRLVIAYNNLAWLAASRRERLDDALGWIRKARELAPKDAMLCDTHGWVLRARGDLEGAIAVLAEGVALRPSAELHYHLGVVQMEKGRAEDARGNLRAALQLKPDFPDAMDAKKRLGQLESTAASKK